MEVYKGKVIELQTENYLVKADLELMTNKGEEQEDKLKEKMIKNNSKGFIFGSSLRNRNY